MGLLDRPGVARLAEVAEDYLGVGFRTTEALQRATIVEQEYVALAGEAEALAIHSLDYLGGRPTELTAEVRKSIAQKSRIAFMLDPLAGAEASLLGDFSFGKGVPIPTARDPHVQQVIDEAWTDANNEEKFTGFMAQRKLSNELLTSGELFITLYVAGGRVRVGRLDPDTVDGVVPDPEDRNRPLWYLARRRRFRWNFTTHAPEFTDDLSDTGNPVVRYWKHWRNYDDAVMEREQGLVDPGEDELITPPSELQAKGVVFHIAINQTGEQARGNPPWARSLRFFSAMNVLTESHVAMAQAASTFIARQTTLGGNLRSVQRSAAAVLGHASELGAGRRLPPPAGADRQAFAPGAGRPPAPGSYWFGNDAARIESLALQSGAGQMQQTAQIVRAPISAAAGFGQHYLGDASDTNLATASTLELPATMRIESWQEYFAQAYRWFTDRAIEAAVKAGRFGGLDGFPDEGPLGEMRLHEAEDRAAMERRTRTDLSYSFTMPFPGRRQLPDVMTFVTGLMDNFDPNGVNVPLRRAGLRWAMEQIGMPDVARLVEDAIPEEGMEGGIGPQGFNPTPPEMDPAVIAAMAGGGGGGAGGRARRDPAGRTPPEREGARNVRRRSPPPSEEAVYMPPELAAVFAEFEQADVEAFRSLVTVPSVEALLRLDAPEPALAGANGAGR